jgi:hypothetical protein
MVHTALFQFSLFWSFFCCETRLLFSATDLRLDTRVSNVEGNLGGWLKAVKLDLGPSTDLSFLRRMKFLSRMRDANTETRDGTQRKLKDRKGASLCRQLASSRFDVESSRNSTQPDLNSTPPNYLRVSVFSPSSDLFLVRSAALWLYI